MPKYRYTLEGKGNGFLYQNLLRKEKLEELEFPVSAFRDFCNRKGIHFPFDADGVSPAKEEATNKPKELADDDLEIIESVTVGELRSYLKADSPEYLPRLLAVLMAKKAVIQKRDLTDKDGFRKYGTRKNPLKALAEDEVKKALEGVGIGKSVALDTTSVARILVKDKYPNNGTGGSY